MNKLDAIRARWAAATPGPWIMERSGPCYEVVRRPGGLRIAWVPYDFGPDEDEANAIAIADARADIPLLLAVAEAAREWRWSRLEYADAVAALENATADMGDCVVGALEWRVDGAEESMRDADVRLCAAIAPLMEVKE